MTNTLLFWTAFGLTLISLFNLKTMSHPGESTRFKLIVGVVCGAIASVLSLIVIVDTWVDTTNIIFAGGMILAFGCGLLLELPKALKCIRARRG